MTITIEITIKITIILRISATQQLGTSGPLFSGDHVAFTGSVVAKHPCPSCASMFHLFGRNILFAKRSCSGKAGSSDQRERCFKKENIAALRLDAKVLSF